MTQAIRIESVSKVYPLGKTEVRALKNIDLSIAEGEFTTIAGPSGCDKDLTRLRLEKLGFIFQSFNLIPVLTVYQNIEFPLLIHGGYTPKDRARIISELIEEVGLKEQARQKSNELSGGQRQRVAIARALVTNPRIVLADEPTANLDSSTGERIINLMKDINKTHKTTFIFSTHDPQVMKHAGRIVRLKDGEVVES